MFNRKFVGFDDGCVHENVAISWDGFNGKGTFCVDEIDPYRLERYLQQSWLERGWMTNPTGPFLLCEQTDIGRSTQYKNIQSWYKNIHQVGHENIKVREKFAVEKCTLPKAWLHNMLQDINGVNSALVFNSTVSVELMLFGVPVISFDEGDPCYAVNSHNFTDDLKFPDKKKFLDYLVHCQWHFDEIENGDWWEKLKIKQGPKLNEFNSK